MERGSEIPLLEAALLMRGIIVSCIDKKQFPFSKTQLNIFTALAMEGEMTMKRVARYLACPQEQATRAVAPLVDAGYVERRTDPANRTRVYIHLTEEGILYLRELQAGLKANLDSRLAQALTEEDQEDLKQTAAHLTSLLRKVSAAEK